MTKPRPVQSIARRNENVFSAKKISPLATLCILCAFLTLTALAASAQTFTTLVNFDLTDGANPASGSLAQGMDGSFYGTTVSGGANDVGTVFRLTPSGVIATIHSFDGADGAYPQPGSLLQAPDGYFYGTTAAGGPNDCGTVFKIGTNGALTTLHNFDGHDGKAPIGTLVLAPNGNFYGTTAFGGAKNAGTIFSMAPNGTLTTLHSFSIRDGQYPESGLVAAADGKFYGTTVFGGAYVGNDCISANNQAVRCGTIFRITPAGAFTTVHSFNSTDGFYPNGLIQGTDGNFYGTTNGGGDNLTQAGTVFRITSTGTLTTLYDFCPGNNCSSGFGPFDTLAQGSDGNFYGTTSSGGVGGGGTIFKITSSGVLTLLYSFCQPGDGCANGASPIGLLQGTDGGFYGATDLAGAYGDGTIFRLGTGLKPFVGIRPTSGEVGIGVVILGSELAGATEVSFNGTPTTFTRISNTEIEATVPRGATSGEVVVTTPKGTLKSNVKFRVP